MSLKKPKVVAIVGPTASGKTSLSIELAKNFNGEVISCDSRQVYRGLDLGTGKVTQAEMCGVVHHLLDVVEPSTIYTASDFKRDSDSVLVDIILRKKLPIVAGGTFFYLDVLKGKMSTAQVDPNNELRQILETKSVQELYEELTMKDRERALDIDKDNPRRLIRALEIVEALGKVPKVAETDPPYVWLTLGIDVPLDVLRERIHTRIMDRIEEGMIEEVADLQSSGLSFQRMEDLGLEYRYIGRYLQGLLSKEDMIEQLHFKTCQFAKRQRMWLKRDESIVWFPFPVATEAIIEKVHTFLDTN